MKSRISINDSLMDAVMKLGEGNQILSNHQYGYLSSSVLLHHIKNQLAFEKLYTQDEMKGDSKNWLWAEKRMPLLEQDLHEKLAQESPVFQFESSEMRDLLKEPRESLDELLTDSYNYEINHCHSGILTPKDTYDNMPVDTLVMMLADKGFLCGCEMAGKIDSANVVWKVYYQPETGCILSLIVGDRKKLNYCGGTMVTLRKNAAAIPFHISGNSSKLDEDDIFLYSKNIRKDLFAWYDAMCETSEPCLQWKIDKTHLGLDMDFMTSFQFDWYRDYMQRIKDSGSTTYYSLFQLLCTLSNLEHFNEDLMCLLGDYKAGAWSILAYEINRLVNWEVSIESCTNAINWLLEKLGKDISWLEKNGIKLEKILRANPSFNLTVPVDKKVFNFPKQEFGYDDEDVRLLESTIIRQMASKLNCPINGSNYDGRVLIKHLRWGTSSAKVTRGKFCVKKINTDLSEEEVRSIFKETLQENGFICL